MYSASLLRAWSMSNWASTTVGRAAAQPTPANTAAVRVTATVLRQRAPWATSDPQRRLRLASGDAVDDEAVALLEVDDR
jgi:hypothetical protein